MGAYFFTLLVFLLSFILPIIFSVFTKKRQSRKILFWVQVIFFVYWNVVCWGCLLFGVLPRELAVPKGSAPEGSVFMLYWYLTPVFAFLLFLERKELKVRRTPAEKTGQNQRTEDKRAEQLDDSGS